MLVCYSGWLVFVFWCFLFIYVPGGRYTFKSNLRRPSWISPTRRLERRDPGSSDPAVAAVLSPPPHHNSAGRSMAAQGGRGE
ncbi:hypothetical protein FKM82_000531 [Ascaphus truei]